MQFDTSKQSVDFSDRRLSVAPMMDWTDRHCRYFHRLLAPSAVLYTEMVTTGAVLHGDQEHLLGFNDEEHPLSLQLGGSEPDELATSARIAETRGFDEVNLNIGCPSDRVQRGRFGACLMLEPVRVRECAAAMRAAVGIPVTVKCRLGVDDCDSYNYFSDFIHEVAGSGVDVFAVHARKAWLSGLSPKENREIPELRYDWVYRLKRENPKLTILLNGGVTGAEDMRTHLAHVDGVMLGRAAYHDPWSLTRCQRLLTPDQALPDRDAVIDAMTRYLDRQVLSGVPVKCVSRHLLGLFHGQPGARAWRRYIAEHAHLPEADSKLLERARDAMDGVGVPDRDAA
ncbi:tRNA dihydrouridine(20/20a) synthase DusA [Elongatibacter sediminis]|uniref:tRNA-dihydrouridine(20/20a) synthase n=1 Tax=Elongatibacter sediminis TaxID=3119006 RepID=A0AAW9RIY0_9GAMM